MAAILDVLGCREVDYLAAYFSADHQMGSPDWVLCCAPFPRRVPDVSSGYCFFFLSFPFLFFFLSFSTQVLCHIPEAHMSSLRFRRDSSRGTEQNCHCDTKPYSIAHPLATMPPAFTILNQATHDLRSTGNTGPLNGSCPRCPVQATSSSPRADQQQKNSPQRQCVSPGDYRCTSSFR